MDKIARLRQEIERRINILTNVYDEQLERKDEEMMNYYHGKVIALEELLPFLDTLSEEPDKSLEEEVKSYFQGYFPGTETVEQCNTDLHFTPPAIIRLARHFAQWGAEHLRDSTKMIDKSLEEAASNYITSYYASHHQEPDMTSLFIAGAEWQKEQDEKEQADLFTIVALDAAQRAKEQMLKEAVEGYVNYYEDSGGILMAEAQVGCPYHNGDKVRIVVLKAEEE